MNKKDLKINYRCPICRRLICKGQIVFIETRCPKCKNVITIKGQ